MNNAGRRVAILCKRHSCGFSGQRHVTCSNMFMGDAVLIESDCQFSA